MSAYTFIFDSRDRAKEERLMDVLDYINNRYGANTLRLISTILDEVAVHGDLDL